MDLTGQILISMPNMLDERFYKTVIYICAHSKEGSMGIIINKNIDHDNYPNILEQLGIDKSLNDKKIFIVIPFMTNRFFTFCNKVII